MFISWMAQLQQQAQSNPNLTFWDMITGDAAGAITVGMLLVAYVIYALAIIVFCFFYTLFGCVLYVLGPLVLALIPVSGIGQLGKTYAINVMIWNAWGILYAIFGSLITAIQFNRVDTVMNQGFLRGFFLGSSESTILGLVSVFYALALGLIPFIAKKLISGDVGSTAYSMVRAGAVAAGALVSGVSGFAAGAGASSGVSPSVGTGAGAAATGTASPAATASSAAPPPQPSLAQTIRSGIMSAVTGGAPPAPASSGGGSTSPQAAAASSSASAGSASPRRSSSTFRPIGVTQTVAFHAGKFAGSIVGGNGSRDNENA
jgi:hypothetical protein